VSIGDYAFAYCDSLTDITISDSVTSIGANVFYDCSNLSGINIPKNLSFIGEGAFYGCYSLSGISVDNANSQYSSENGVLFNKNKTTLITYPRMKSGTSYTIPSSVTSIGSYAFFYCESLTDVTIPHRVASIGERAFSGCGLTSVIIPSSVRSIGDEAFRNCEELVRITFGRSGIALGYQAFYCDSMQISPTLAELYESRYMGGAGTYTRTIENIFWEKI
jgi:hypothetical protein